MRRKSSRPWLTGSGVEIPTIELKDICASWDAITWEAYLNWYQGSCREKLVTPAIYHQLGEERVETIFEMFTKTETPAKRNLIERLLSQLPVREAEILRATYLDGRTQVEIAADFCLSRPRISQLKSAAFLRLNRGLSGDKFTARQFMRGVKDSVPAPEPLLWDQPMDPELNEDRGIDFTLPGDEISRIKSHALREALSRLSQTERLSLYWKFWSGLSLRDVARRLAIGANVAGQVSDASIVKIKRFVIQFLTGNQI